MTLVLNDVFTETLPINISFKFNNLHLQTGAGIRQTIVTWNHPLIEYDLRRTLSDVKTSTKNRLRDFFNEVKGQQNYFSYLDPIDNSVTKDPLIGDRGEYTQGLVVHNNGKLQLYKAYQLAGAITYRPINNPIADSTFKLYRNGNLINAGYTVNEDTGRVFFAYMPGDILTWSGYFYTPVRFSENILSFILKTISCPNGELGYEIPTFKLLEVKQPVIPLVTYNHIPLEINHIFHTGSNIDEVEELQSSGILNEFDSGFENRQNNFDFNFNEESYNYFRSYKIPTYSTATQEDFNYLISFWRVTRGGAVKFFYEGDSSSRTYQARGDLSIEINQNENTQCGVKLLGSYSNISLVEVVN